MLWAATGHQKTVIHPIMERINAAAIKAAGSPAAIQH